MAAKLEDRYIFSRKPAPSLLARPRLDGDAARSDVRATLEHARGCIVELVMKDNHTLAHRPENAVAWCRIAKEEAERIKP